ncbi:MAG: type 1 glutamine amidotransferase domain-containing protein [Bacteroidota bacterium]
MEKLKGIKVAILATNGFEESELFEPKKALEENGAEVDVVAPEKGKIKAWNHGNWSREIDVNVVLNDADENNYDALVIPGGVINPDKLRRDENAVDFVSSFFRKNKTVASICHGPQMLIEAEVVKGRKLTSFFSIKKDLQNAGANWVDQEVVVDDGLITSRNPGDLEVFNRTIVEEFSKLNK